MGVGVCLCEGSGVVERVFVWVCNCGEGLIVVLVGLCV